MKIEYENEQVVDRSMKALRKIEKMSDFEKLVYWNQKEIEINNRKSEEVRQNQISIASEYNTKIALRDKRKAKIIEKKDMMQKIIDDGYSVEKIERGAGYITSYFASKGDVFIHAYATWALFEKIYGSSDFNAELKSLY